MKKILYINNQEDLIKALCNNNTEKINVEITASQNNYRKETKQESFRKKSYQESNKKNLIVIDYLLLENLGMVLLKKTIDYYNKEQHLILLDVKDSLAYLLFALENNFKFIFTTLKNQDIDNIILLAENQGSKIFNFTENIFECLIIN
ncbi:MAG: hypothetical protein LBH40_04715 [Alphaproteobacteria bacterium]|jgi:hypothetical protein|nr:hypothetical protein [Alphaproteobacteria bacterium]